MKAATYIDFVDWKAKDMITEPPFTLTYTEEDLNAQIENHLHLKVPFAPFHTQSVERMIKLVSEVSSRVSGFSKRHFEILNTLHSRKAMPKFDNKKMYPMLNTEP